MAESPESTDRAPDERARLREGLLDQLRHLVREAEMLEGVVARVPEKLLAEAPPAADGGPLGERSIKEVFGLIARLDEAVHPRRIERILQEDAPRLVPAGPEALLADEDWNAQPLTALLARVRAARQALAGMLEATAPAGWLRTGLFPPGSEEEAEAADEPQERDLYEMVHALCRRDTARLEAMTRRLYESRMGPPPQERA